jgi:hypothetical protein
MKRGISGLKNEIDGLRYCAANAFTRECDDTGTSADGWFCEVKDAYIDETDCFHCPACRGNEP